MSRCSGDHSVQTTDLLLGQVVAVQEPFFGGSVEVVWEHSRLSKSQQHRELRWRSDLRLGIHDDLASRVVQAHLCGIGERRSGRGVPRGDELYGARHRSGEGRGRVGCCRIRQGYRGLCYWRARQGVGDRTGCDRLYR